MNADTAWLDLSTAVDFVARRELTASDLVDTLLARIDRLNPALNAYVAVLADSAREDAAAADAMLRRGKRCGPLHGVPLAVKDIIHVRGAPTAAGSLSVGRRLRSRDAACVRRLREAGAILLGKLHTHELAGGVPSEDKGFVRARNPWSLEHVTGGSSSGPAVAVAAALAYGTLGTDTGGSIRIPAAFCGVVGLKPTYGRVSRYGVLARSWTMDHVGPLARRVRDAALLLQVISGHDGTDPYSSRRRVPNFCRELGQGVRGLRAGVLRGPFFESDVDPEVGAAFETAVAVLRDLGVQPAPVMLRCADAAQAAGMVVTLAEAASVQDEVIRERPDDFGEDFRRQILSAEFISARQYIRALRVRPVVQRELEEHLRGVDVFVSPATQALPNRSDGSAASESPWDFSRHSRLFSLAGLPAISVPAGFSRSGLPIGLQIVGPPFGEATVLRVAHAYEAAAGWYLRRPPEVSVRETR